MDTSTIDAFLTAAGACAMSMLSNGMYIEKELPNVTFPDGLHARVQHLCGSLIGTHFDINTEIAEFGEALTESPQDYAAVFVKTERILRWLSEPIVEMHELVQELRSASETDEQYILATILIEESATNVLNAYNAAADVLKKAREV